MKVAPDTYTRLARAEDGHVELDVPAQMMSARLVSSDGTLTELVLSGNVAALPQSQPVPALAAILWFAQGAAEPSFSTAIECVSRHYFTLEELRAYGGGTEDFKSLPKEALFRARAAATETFEAACNRSFVCRVGETRRFLAERFMALDHCDVEELLTAPEGYRLISDCQVSSDAGEIPSGAVSFKYLYGAPVVPEEVSRAVLKLAAYRLRPSVYPENATGESSEAGFLRFTVAGRDGATPIPEVNAAVLQYGRPAWAWF